MTDRQRRKPGETREKLMGAALALVGKGRNFGSLGIREVTRQAGVVPTSFYRHFRNVDDLGLQLVDELGLVLRRMMREARENVLQADKLIEESVGIFLAHAQANRSFFLFMAQGLAGESRAVREGIRSEMRFFSNELANDLRRLKLVNHLADADLEMTCDLAVRSVAFSLTDLLGIAPDDNYQVDQIRKRTTRFLQLIFVGAAHWNSQAEH
jgi:AcrR family transcriptional regulator